MPTNAAKRGPAPTGNGPVVLPYVLNIAHALNLSYGPLVVGDLTDRAEMGKAKYGTYLRAQNGRDAEVDLLQELYDAAMYSGQCRMEEKPGGEILETVLKMAAQVAGSIHRRKS